MKKFSKLYVEDMERRAHSATIELRALGTFKLVSDENVPSKREDFLQFFCECKFNAIYVFKMIFRM